MGKLKYSLISLLAVCLTAGGVFAAWTFSEGIIENPDPVGVDVSTEGLGGMEFMHVNVKFDANGGQFPDGTTEKSVTSKKYQAITADAYTSLFKTYADFPTKQVEGQTRYFSNWSVNPGDDSTDYFSFDNGFTEDDTLYAIYVPSTNPAIYKNFDDASLDDELLGYLRVNSGSEYYMRNFIATGMKNHSNNKRGFHYVIKQGATEYKVLASKTLNKSTYGFQINQGTDYLVNGLYNIYFDATKTPNEGTTSGDLGWFVYGGKAFFEPQYNYRLVGNPVASNTADENGNTGWSDPSPNPVTFRYVSTSADGKTKNYVIDRVDFPFWEGEATREFKPYIANFGFYPLRDWDYQNSDKLYPKMYHASDTTTKAHLGYSGDSKGANLKILNSSVLAYKVTMSVTYEDRKPFDVSYDNGVNETYISFNNYPVSMTVGLEPYEHKINIYENTNAAEPSQVKYALSNAIWSERTNYPDKTHNLISLKYNGIGWRDYFTDKEIDFSEININKSYHIYPVYEEQDALTYDLILSVVEGGKYIDVPIAIYEGKKVSASIDYYLNHETDDEFDNLINKYLNPDYNISSNPISDNYLSNMSYNFDGYVSGSTLNDDVVPLSDILDSSLKKDTTYKARYISTKEVLKYYTANSNTYKWVSPNDVSSSPTYNLNKEITVYKYNGVALETGTYLYSSNRFDFSEEPSPHDILTSGAVIFPTFNGDSWTFYRVVLEKIGKSDYKGSSATFAIYAFGSGEEWYRPVNGPGSTLNARFYIDIKYPKIIFCRMDSSGKNDWANKWNQSSDIIISDFYFAGNTNIEYTVWYW